MALNHSYGFRVVGLQLDESLSSMVALEKALCSGPRVAHTRYVKHRWVLDTPLTDCLAVLAEVGTHVEEAEGSFPGAEIDGRYPEVVDRDGGD